VHSMTVEAPVRPKTLFIVTAVINDHRLTFIISPETCLVRTASCACPDFQHGSGPCKHMLRALLEMAGLLPPPPPSPAVGMA
jgi:hypothetical protein